MTQQEVSCLTWCPTWHGLTIEVSVQPRVEQLALVFIVHCRRWTPYANANLLVNILSLYFLTCILYCIDAYPSHYDENVNFRYQCELFWYCDIVEIMLWTFLDMYNIQHSLLDKFYTLLYNNMNDKYSKWFRSFWEFFSCWLIINVDILTCPLT